MPLGNIANEILQTKLVSDSENYDSEKSIPYILKDEKEELSTNSESTTLIPNPSRALH